MTLVELRECDREFTALGQASLTLARRLDAAQDTGSGLAALERQWQASFEAATANAKAAADPVDQLLARRQARLGA